MTLKRLDDLEELIKQFKTYLTETVTVEIDGVDVDMMRINFYIQLMNARKGDSLLNEIVQDSSLSRFTLAERVRDFNAFKEWIDISAGEDIEMDSNFNTVSKLYLLQVSSLIQDDMSSDVYFKSIRMGEVLKNIMVQFFRDNSFAGLMDGRVEGAHVPFRVSLKGSKALKSIVVYRALIQ
jgi:hypothetical protein